LALKLSETEANVIGSKSLAPRAALDGEMVPSMLRKPLSTAPYAA
jgi:hypothetical protein